jgi:1-acyl-sn-glycerol-3-phosphate acyltransferase
MRAVLALPIAFVYTMVLSAMAAISGGLGWDDGADWIIRIWGLGILRLVNVKVRIIGSENIPAQKGVLFLFNHQSFFDIFAVQGHAKRRVRFGAKIELFSVPVFNLAMKGVGVLPIAREKRHQVMKVYQAAEKKFSEGWSYILAPEGTRQNEPRIGTFKRGPFIFAVNAQVPIVPLVICGTYQVLPKRSLLMNVGCWSRSIDLIYLPMVSTQGLSPEDVPALMQKVREQMVAAYQAFQN